ncbi:GAF domain-containing protein [Chloroflexota bacterium]
MKEKYRILLVEDNKIVQKAFAGLVKQKNLPYDYVVAGSIAETRQVLINNQFDVALLDYLLDDGTAFDLFADMGDTPIIIVTGSGDEATAVEAMKAGALDYVIKDPTGNYLTTLPAIIKRVINRHHAEQELKIYREQLEGLVSERTNELAQANEQLMAEIAERKQTEEALRESEGKYRNLVDLNPDPVVILQDGQYQLVNPAFTELFGYTQQDVDDGLSFLKLVQDHDQDAVRRQYEDRLAGKRLSRTYRIDLIAKDGTLISCETSASLIQYKDRPADLVIIDNITERKQAEDLARAQRDLDLSAVHGLDEMLRLCVESAIRVTGMDCGGIYLVDKTSGDIDLAFHQGLPSDLIESASHYDADSANARLVMEGKPIYAQHQALGTPLDEIRRRESLRAIAIIPVRYENQVIACLNIASHTLDDVPEFARTTLETIATQIGSAVKRAQAEAALRKSKERLQLALEASTDGLFDWNMQTNQTYFSPRYYTMLGYEPYEMPPSNETWISLLHPDDKELALNTVNEMIEQKRDTHEIEFRMKTKSGGWRWILSRGKIIKRDDEDKPIRMVGTHVDITERKRAEQLLQALNQAALAMEHALTPEAIFAAVAEEFKKLNLFCTIFLVDESQNRLFPKHVSYEPGAVKVIEKLTGLRAEDFLMPIDTVDVFRKVIRERETLFIGDSKDATRQLLPKPLKRFTGQIVKIMNVPKYIAAPLVVEDEVVGILSVQSADLSEDDIPAITAFAYQMAAAWRKSQLFEQAQQEIAERKRVEEEIKRRNRELDLLNRVIAASATSLEPSTILETTCGELAQAFELPHVSAVLINETETTAEVVAEYRDEDQPVALGITTYLVNNPPMQYLLTHKTPLIMDEAQAHPDLAAFHNQLGQGNIVSLVILPLIVEQKIIGCLNLYIDESSNLSTEDVSLAWSVAEQVSGALARAQLNKAHQQLAEQLRQSQKMEAIGRLAGGMAHDFNNLLTVITGYSELLLHRHVSKDTPQYKSIEQIHKAGERATALTRQLLAFSRQQVIQPKVLDLNAIISDTHEMLRRLVSEDIDLSTTLDPVLGRIKADSGQIEQIILNLVVNACDAMPQGGKLTIKTANIDPDEAYAGQHLGLEPGPYVLLTISDTGIGMDEETQSHIFEPFFTTKETGKGTGLGLATVYGIVRQNKGYISTSSQPEQGTTFHVYLPRLDPTLAAISRDQKPAGTIQGAETILLVEDEDMVRQLAHYALLEDGYHMLEAGHGQEALRVSEQYDGPIHLLLTDIVMPGGLGGRELAERLTSLRPETKVLYMSGYTDDTIIHHGVLDSDITFLQKPFSPTVLSRKVREVLDEPGQK